MSFATKMQARRAQLRKKEYWPRERLEQYQARSLRLLRQFAYTNSPFYKNFHRGLMDRPLEELPSLPKSVLMEHFDEIVTDPSVRREDMEHYLTTDGAGKLFLDRYFLTASSGTTGNKAMFLSNLEEWLTTLASLSRQGEWMGLQPGKRKVVYALSTVPWHASARAAHFANRNITSVSVLDAGDPLDSIVERLNEWQPDVLTVYASLARVLAEEQFAGRLRIRPEVICTGGDVLTEETYRRIVKAWGQVPYNGYAASESSVLAAECRYHSGMHMYEDLVIIENVDKQGRAVPPGEYGEKLLITVPFRRTIPLIRYELEDIVRISEKTCPCGRTFRLIDDIRGRANEVLWMRRPSGERTSIHPNFFYRVLDVFPVSEWQVIYKGDRMDVLVTNPSDEFREASLVGSLAREIAACGAVPPQINVVRVPQIPRGKTGKALLVKSAI